MGTVTAKCRGRCVCSVASCAIRSASSACSGVSACTGVASVTAKASAIVIFFSRNVACSEACSMASTRACSAGSAGSSVWIRRYGSFLLSALTA